MAAPAHGLISLDPAVEPRTAKLKNIVGNPHQFVFKELDLLTMPRALNSVDAAIGYVSQFDAGKVPREKGILFPPAPRTFASQLVIGTPYLSQENIVKLKQAFSDPRIQTWLKTTDDPLVKRRISSSVRGISVLHDVYFRCYLFPLRMRESASFLCW